MVAFFTHNYLVNLTASLAIPMTTPSAISDRLPDTRKVPWHAACPPPRYTEPLSVPRTEVLRLFQDGSKQGKDFILIDLRTDHKVTSTQGNIRHVTNILTCHIGRYDPRVPEPPSTFPTFDDPDTVYHTFCGQD